MKLVASLAEIGPSYGAAFVDLWGCVHDGIRAYPEACAALAAYRRAGGRVVLVTNSPRPRRAVEAQIADFGVPPDAWDAIATSGDAARVAMFEGAVGTRVWAMASPHEESFFEPPAILDRPAAIERVSLAEAEGIVCLGPPDPFADPRVHERDFADAIGRGLKLLCANPDIVVDRGHEREWCAGALAALYTQMGGESLYFGKPHAPIYDLARRRLERLGPLPEKILCVGDGPGTDIAGAVDQGLDSLLITGGLLARETRTPPGGQPDPATLDGTGVAATYAIGFLR